MQAIAPQDLATDEIQPNWSADGTCMIRVSEKVLVSLVSAVLATVAVQEISDVVATEDLVEIIEKNWENHPGIVEARSIYSAIKAGIAKKDFELPLEFHLPTVSG